MICRLTTDAYRLRYLASFVVSDRQIANIHAFGVMVVGRGLAPAEMQNSKCKIKVVGAIHESPKNTKQKERFVNRPYDTSSRDYLPLCACVLESNHTSKKVHPVWSVPFIYTNYN